MLNPNQSTEQMVKTDNVSTTSKQEPDQTSIIEPTKTIVEETPVKKSSKKTASKKIKNGHQNQVSIPIPTVTSKLNTDKFGTSTPSFDVSKISNNNYRFAPARNDAPIKDGSQLPSTDTKSRTDWQDALYKTAVLTQPLWGKAKAEPVNYDLPYVNFVPTSIDVTNDLANIDRNAAAAQYDLANRYRNTGAGLAATLQLAQNRSAQQSAIRQWQTNAQNELIGKNVGIYNDWSKTRTGIMNDVYDKVAQNKAAARNINRQNVATALKNWGQIRRDEKLQDVQSSALNMYAPAIKAVMEDPYSVLNPLYNLNR